MRSLHTVFAVHGGAAYYQSLQAIEVNLSAWGFLFTIKGVSPLAAATYRPDRQASSDLP